MNHQAYWLVWRENGDPPRAKHDTESSARTEAERLARSMRGERFTVLRSVATVFISDVSWVELPAEAAESELPF